MKRLFDRFNDDLKIEDIHQLSDEEFKELIKETNYNKQKVKYIKHNAEHLINENDGKMYDSLEDIVKLKGVGNKIGILLMQTVYNQNVGIAVDTHVHKIANRLEWVDTKNAEQTRVKLEPLVEKSQWPHVNGLIVGFGQNVCLSVNPKCQSCLLRDECGYYDKKGKQKKAKSKQK